MSTKANKAWLDDNKTHSLQVNDARPNPVNTKPLSGSEEQVLNAVLVGNSPRDILVAFRAGKKNFLLSRGDLQHLLTPKQWLNDREIDMYLLQLAHTLREAPEAPTAEGNVCNFHVVTVFWYTCLTDALGGYDYKRVQTWSRKNSGPRLDVHKVLIPVQVRKSHWVLGVINLRDKRFEFYDSFRRSPGTEILNNMRRWLSDECRANDVRAAKHMNVDHWPDYVPSCIPRQTNSYDCGIFMLMNSVCVAHDFEMTPHTFLESHMPQLRKRVALELLQRSMPVQHGGKVSPSLLQAGPSALQSHGLQPSRMGTGQGTHLVQGAEGDVHNDDAEWERDQAEWQRCVSEEVKHQPQRIAHAGAQSLTQFKMHCHINANPHLRHEYDCGIRPELGRGGQQGDEEGLWHVGGNIRSDHSASTLLNILLTPSITSLVCKHLFLPSSMHLLLRSFKHFVPDKMYLSAADYIAEGMVHQCCRLHEAPPAMLRELTQCLLCLCHVITLSYATPTQRRQTASKLKQTSVLRGDCQQFSRTFSLLPDALESQTLAHCDFFRRSCLFSCQDLELAFHSLAHCFKAHKLQFHQALHIARDCLRMSILVPTGTTPRFIIPLMQYMHDLHHTQSVSWQACHVVCFSTKLDLCSFKALKFLHSIVTKLDHIDRKHIISTLQSMDSMPADKLRDEVAQQVLHDDPQSTCQSRSHSSHHPLVVCHRALLFERYFMQGQFGQCEERCHACRALCEYLFILDDSRKHVVGFALPSQFFLFIERHHRCKQMHTQPLARYITHSPVSVIIQTGCHNESSYPAMLHHMLHLMKERNIKCHDFHSALQPSDEPASLGVIYKLQCSRAKPITTVDYVQMLAGFLQPFHVTVHDFLHHCPQAGLGWHADPATVGPSTLFLNFLHTNIQLFTETRSLREMIHAFKDAVSNAPVEHLAEHLSVLLHHAQHVYASHASALNTAERLLQQPLHDNNTWQLFWTDATSIHNDLILAEAHQPSAVLTVCDQYHPRSSRKSAELDVSSIEHRLSHYNYIIRQSLKHSQQLDLWNHPCLGRAYFSAFGRAQAHVSRIAFHSLSWMGNELRSYCDVMHEDQGDNFPRESRLSLHIVRLPGDAPSTQNVEEDGHYCILLQRSTPASLVEVREQGGRMHNIRTAGRRGGAKKLPGVAYAGIDWKCLEEVRPLRSRLQDQQREHRRTHTHTSHPARKQTGPKRKHEGARLALVWRYRTREADREHCLGS